MDQGRVGYGGTRALKLIDLVMALQNNHMVDGVENQEVLGLAADSRLVKPGDLFVCIPGSRVDAHQFIGQAVERGAVAVVAQKEFSVPAGVGAILVEDSRYALSALADLFYGYPSRKIKTVGITGTNGKTTAAFLCKAVAEAGARKAGVLGTAGTLLGDEVLEYKSGYTTPEPHTLHRLLAEMVQRAADVVALEVTSHALIQSRVAHCRFDVAVFTNLTHEHLDYHQDMESYFEAKALLFRMLRPGAAAVINIDDPFGRRMVEVVPPGVRIMTYGFASNAVIRASDVSLTLSGAHYHLTTPIGGAKVDAPYLFGHYNVSNALAALATGMALGYGMSTGVEAMRWAKGAPGRFERVDAGQDFTVVVDYAHTPDGFEKLLSDVVRIKSPTSKVTMVFGSAGHRDQTKRPDMGRIAGQYCDRVVLTEEDPRTEDAMEIARQIATGIRRPEVEIQLVEDRVEAIETAIRLAGPGDIVLITGKGNETELEVQHSTSWTGDVPAARAALDRLLSDASRRRVTA